MTARMTAVPRRARQTPTLERPRHGMLLLFETPAGFSLFKVKDEKKLDDVEVRRDR